MRYNPLPDADLLATLLSYEPETGNLFWLPRTPALFQDEKRLTAAGRCAQWNGRYAGKEALSAITESGYRRGILLGGSHYAHRVIWKMWYGEDPSDQIDHDNRIRSDNRISNLFDATRSRNLKNTKISAANTSGMMGVYYHEPTGKWQVRIVKDGVRQARGLYTTFEQACAVRAAAEVECGYHPNHGRS